MPVVARDVHETRLCEHFHVAGESVVLQISVPDPETKHEGVRICFQRELTYRQGKCHLDLHIGEAGTGDDLPL